MSDSRQKPVLVKYGNVIGAVSDGLDKGFLEIVTRTVTQAKALVPVDEGYLGASIMGISPLDDKVGYLQSAGETPPKTPPALRVTPEDEHSCYVGSAVEYAVYQEFGTRFVPASPYLRPAIQIVASPRNSASIIAKYNSDEVRNEVKRRHFREAI